jgi:hypothetical protein
MVIWDKDLIFEKNPKGFFEEAKNENLNVFKAFGKDGEGFISSLPQAQVSLKSKEGDVL